MISDFNAKPFTQRQRRRFQEEYEAGKESYKIGAFLLAAQIGTKGVMHFYKHRPGSLADTSIACRSSVR